MSTFCQHNFVYGRCQRCNSEVDALAIKASTRALTSWELAKLNTHQRGMLDTILMATLHFDNVQREVYAGKEKRPNNGGRGVGSTPDRSGLRRAPRP